jgi:hypothetical protein
MRMRAVAVLQLGFLLAAILASATSTKTPMQITVLDSETRAAARDDNNGVPKNCEQLTFDAYCRSTTNVPLISTLLVQEGSEPPFRISCTIDSRYSRCVPLPKGETFEAKREKRGIAVYYVDDNGKARKQLYTLVAGEISAGEMSAPAVAVAPAHNAAVTSSPVAAPVPVATPTPIPAATSAPASAVPVTPRPAAASTGVQVSVPSRIKCSFTSTPTGAEITLDGKYVGSTPSEIEVGAGTHAVVFSLPGFVEWKRDLTVMAGSQLTVNAILQKP